MKVVSTGGKLPTRKHDSDAGLDLYAAEDVTLLPLEPATVRTGIKIKLPDNTFGLLKPKSRHTFHIGAGVIDLGYTGEIKVRILPFEYQKIKAGEPIAQLIVLPYVCVGIDQADQLEETPRGEDGGINRNEMTP